MICLWNRGAAVKGSASCDVLDNAQLIKLPGGGRRRVYATVWLGRVAERDLMSTCLEIRETDGRDG